jgi:hypothetical protein
MISSMMGLTSLPVLASGKNSLSNERKIGMSADANFAMFILRMLEEMVACSHTHTHTHIHTRHQPWRATLFVSVFV